MCEQLSLKQKLSDRKLTFFADIVLLDIEGTTTSISFVKETLFPYAVAEVERHLKETWQTEETRQDVADILAQVDADGDAAEDTGTSNACLVVGAVAGAVEAQEQEEQVRAVVQAVRAMVATDRKVSCLKQLQGHLWRKGFEQGELRGHVYPDVSPALQRWGAAGVQRCVYSSGSVEAQRLLFRHSVEGDLTHHFTHHFDTTVGLKTNSVSYSCIAEQIGAAPGDILFITDVAAEARAATAAGLQVLLSIRPGTEPGLLQGENLPECHSFEHVHVGRVNRTLSEL